MKAQLHQKLRAVREVLVWKLDGLSDDDVRRPLTPSGTSLLGLVKHNAVSDSRYFGAVFGRPFPEPLPAWDDLAALGRDHRVGEDETRADVIDLHRRVGRHADATIEALDLDALGYVPWWDEEVPLLNVMVHRLTDATRHAGHADILREGIDGAVGVAPPGDGPVAPAAGAPPPVRPRLICVCGVPAAGKTTLARRLGRALHLPVLVRDDLKTGVADTFPDLDWSDPEVRRTVGGKAFDDFHTLIGAHLAAGSAVVAEAAWHWSFAGARLGPLLARSRATVVHVAVDPATSAARYRARAVTGERHAAHQDAAFADRMDGPGYDGQVYVPPADLPCPVVTVDGTLPPDALLATTLAAL